MKEHDIVKLVGHKIFGTSRQLLNGDRIQIVFQDAELKNGTIATVRKELVYRKNGEIFEMGIEVIPRSQ